MCNYYVDLCRLTGTCQSCHFREKALYYSNMVTCEEKAYEDIKEFIRRAFL